jgi:hypothetical protein
MKAAGGLYDMNGGAIMRGAHYAIAVVASILVAFGVKLFFFSAPSAEAGLAVKSSRMDISKIHENTNFPIQKMYDMTFVYSDGD